MKKLFFHVKMCFAMKIIVFVMMVFFTNAIFAEQTLHKPITNELIKLVKENPKIGDMLQKSITIAKKVNPDNKTNPVSTLEDYYNFVDRASELILYDWLENPPSFSIQDQMLQGLCYFYFLIDQPLPELENKGYFRNTLQFYPPFSKWLRNFAKTLGKHLDTNASWNKRIYKRFYKDPSFGLQKGWYEDPSNWHTFNQFFSRYLKSPAMRPIASPDDPSVVISPADSVPQGVFPIDKNSRILVDGGLHVKLATYYSIKELLGKDSAYKDAFKGGVLTHTFLNINDYHRYHFAVGGIVKEKRIIKNNVACEILWDPKQKKYIPVDSTGWQFSQTRGYVIVDTGEFGLVALMPMGMALVSSVNFEDDVKVGSKHKKGDMLGCFLFGGSDFIMLFQKNAHFELTVQKIDKTTYKHILMGEQYGLMKKVAEKKGK